MSRPTDHPDLVAFVAGLLSAESAAAAAEHLRHCAECRDEAGALGSMRASLRALGGAEHPSIEDLVALDAGGPLSADRRRAVEAHIAACADCRSDRQALGRAGGPGSRRTGGLRAGGLRAAVAAAILALAAIGYFGWRRVSRPPAASRPGTAATLPGEPMTIVLAAPTRGGGAERLLPAGRSVRLAIALPFGALAGRYRARLERVEGSVSVAVEQELGPARAGDDGLLTFDLRVPDAPGRRRLLVFAVEGSAAAEPAEAIAIYSCIVAAEAPAPPHRDR